MGKHGLYKITLTREAYENFVKAKRLLGARTWEDLSRKLLEMISNGK